MSFDHDRLQEMLCTHLQEKLKAHNPADWGGSGHLDPDKTEADPVRISQTLDRYQHRIWQLKDRLSCEVYGPHTEGLVDTFLARFELGIPKYSREYYWVLRMVLQTEIDLYTILMHRLSGDNGAEGLARRKMARQRGRSMNCFQPRSNDPDSGSGA